MTFGRTMICLIAWLAVVATPALAEPQLPALAARYREARSDGHAPPRAVEWYLTRKSNQIEIGKPGYVELWERDARGEVSWLRIFHDDRKLIDYSPGELRAQRRDLPWATLSTIIDQRQLLKDLRQEGKTQVLDRPATRYVGTVGNREIEVVWLDAEQLPARVVRRDQVHTYYQLTLQELRPAPAEDWPKSDLVRAASYERIDGADLGDREYDPFVQKVLAMDGHGHGHAH